MNLSQIPYSYSSTTTQINCFIVLFTTVLEILVTNASPTTTASTTASVFAQNVFAQNPFLALSTKIVKVYGDAIRQNMEYLGASSARIIQEQTIKAWTSAAQSCSKALAENAMSSQQQTIERIADANRKAFGMWARDLSPFKMPPMAGLASWFPAIPDAPSSKSGSRRVKQFSK